jgi:hypothetical protein
VRVSENLLKVARGSLRKRHDVERQVRLKISRVNVKNMIENSFEHSWQL